MGSICLHCWVLAWVALGPPVILERSQSPYEREIQPHEDKIVWYKLADKLPDVAPAEARRTAGPLRARAKFDQNMVAGPKDNRRPPQLILAPAPEIAPAKALPLPNIVALAPPPRLVRPFIPVPPPAPAPSKPPMLPDAPKVAAAEPKAVALDVKMPRIERRFTPPAPARRIVPGAPGPLPAAPELAAVADAKPLAIEVKRPRIEREFKPPAAVKRSATADPVPLPAAPELPFSTAADPPRPLPPRKFVAPEKQRVAPAEPAALAPPPPAAISARALPSDTSLVIAGLNPAPSIEVPEPPGSVKGGFSGGPKPSPKGGEGASPDAMLEVPSLSIQGGARNPQPPVLVSSLSPTSPENLAAAMRVGHPRITPGTGGTAPSAVPVSSVPDPRMTGRRVYTMAIQVANLTSYSGSWLVWFAEREADIGNSAVDVRPPLPLNMVSPKYSTTAMNERVEGKVRLWAVIGKDGHVTGISLLQHVDSRLDQSAQEALGKWLFRPAVRNGVPIDVDAVFEVPFTLAPKTSR